MKHSGPELWTSLVRTGEQTFAGFVVERDRPYAMFVVEILLDGQITRLLQAQDHRPEVQEAGYGDGRCGFLFTLTLDEIAAHTVIEARLANVGTPVGRPLPLSSLAGPGVGGFERPNQIGWMGGLRLGGWLAHSGEVEPSDLPTITASAGDKVVAQTKPHRWRHIKSSDGVIERALAFDLYLPSQLADGRLHQIKVETGMQELQGSPVSLIAFDDGLSRFLGRSAGSTEHDWMRADLFDRVMPMSMPFTAYGEWCKRYPLSRPTENSLPLVSVAVVGPHHTRTVESLGDQTHQDWIASFITGSASQLTFDRHDLLQFLSGDGGGSDFIVLAPSGTVLADTALARIAEAARAHPDASAIYGDIDVSGSGGRRWPIFFSAFDYERLLEQGYCANFFAAGSSAVRHAVESGAGNLLEIFFALLGDNPTDPARVVHVPGVLGTLPDLDLSVLSKCLAQAASAHLEGRGLRTTCESGSGSLLAAVHMRRVDLPQSPSVSIVIPTRNRVDLLRACLTSIECGETKHIAEIIVVDNDSSDPETLEFLEDQECSRRLRVLRVPGAFNFSRLNNEGVNIARAPYICLLNNDIEAISPNWLEEMLGRLVEPDVGAVGALLLWPSGVVQHGGVVLGTKFAADHAFADRLADSDPGYGDLLCVAHQCSAVTAACLLTRKADYEAVGGLDETFFPVNFNDVDYCLQLRAREKRVIFTPHARLFHHESVSRGIDNRQDRQRRAQRELAALRARWQDVLLTDPFYSPALALDPYPYSGLAWPPRSMKPRLAASPPPIEIPRGF